MSELGPKATLHRDFTPRAERRRRIFVGLHATDLVMAGAATLGATAMKFGPTDVHIALAGIGYHPSYLLIALAIALTYPLAFYVERLYDIDTLFWGSGEFTRVVHGVTLSLGTVIVASYLLDVHNFSRLWLLYMWGFSCSLLVFGRVLYRRYLFRLRRQSKLSRPTLLIGCNEDARRLGMSLALDHSSGLTLVGCLAAQARDCVDQPELLPGVPIVGHVGQLPEVITRTGADAVVIVSSAFEHAEVSRIVSGVRRLPIDVHVSSGLFDVLPARVLVREVAGTPFMYVRNASLTTYNMALKRTFDLCMSGLLLVLGLPLWLLIAACIKLDSPGPVFYQQQRVGRGGTLFWMHKFRSMHVDADAQRAALHSQNEADGPLFKIRNDPRVTRVGRFLRKYSIDEFPQFLNVLQGDMSVVGPRPPLPSETAAYEAWHSKRLDVLPGITGLWQVSGRSDLTFDEMVRLDLFYIENWSLRYDISLVVRTVPSMILGEGAY